MPQPYATTPSYPRRFIRRHRYQEGPGFLFLATQNSRPPNDHPKPDLEEVRRCMRAVRVAREAGIAAACSEVVARLPRFTAGWLPSRRGESTVWCRAPGDRCTLRPSIPEWVDRVIITIRLLTYWNSKRISAEMRRRQIYEVSHGYIDGLFQAKGCARGSVPRRPGPRYEPTTPTLATTSVYTRQLEGQEGPWWPKLAADSGLDRRRAASPSVRTVARRRWIN